jgi:hypothetical protein
MIPSGPQAREATMQQLGGLDSFFLDIESNSCPMHVGGLVILEPPGRDGRGDGAGDGEDDDSGFSRVFRHVEGRLGRGGASCRRPCPSISPTGSRTRTSTSCTT